MSVQNDDVMLLAGGRIRCRRCSARSKRTKLRFGAPAMKGKKVAGNKLLPIQLEHTVIDIMVPFLNAERCIVMIKKN